MGIPVTDMGKKIKRIATMAAQLEKRWHVPID